MSPSAGRLLAPAGRGSAAPTPGAVADSFTRADSASSLGDVAETGHPWLVPTTNAVWGIASAAAVLKSATAHSLAVVDAGVADCTVKAAVLDNVNGGLCFRVVDDSNNFVININTGGIFKREGGGFTSLATATAAGTGVWAVTLAGSSIKVFKDNVQVASLTSTFNQAATKHGLRCNNAPGQRFDDFAVTV